MEDTQGKDDFRQLPINRVGIKNLKYPLLFTNQAGRTIPVTAMVDIGVNLAHHQKGTHMSRFIEVLNQWKDQVSVANMPLFGAAVLERLHADEAFVKITFPYFIEKEAPISGAKSYMDYAVAISGETREDGHRIELAVTVPVTTLCPCSKSISEYGAHNQRSEVTVTVTGIPGELISIEEIVYSVESSASSELFAILKREDEKEVTERAYQNPAFVEDLVREVALKLSQDQRIASYSVNVINFESIHNHDAYAVIESAKVEDSNDHLKKHHGQTQS